MARYNFKDKVVIITGASSGIGRELAHQLAAQGAWLVLAARNEERLEAAKAECLALGGKAIAIRTDVREPEQCATLVQRTVDEFGRIDVMLSNAGIGDGRGLNKPLWDVSDDDWHYDIDINLSSAFYCARAAARPMMEQASGVIINLGSGTARPVGAGAQPFQRAPFYRPGQLAEGIVAKLLDDTDHFVESVYVTPAGAHRAGAIYLQPDMPRFHRSSPI